MPQRDEGAVACDACGDCRADVIERNRPLCAKCYNAEYSGGVPCYGALAEVKSINSVRRSS
jgi:protein-arginine kinase activator protein McsA